MQYVGSKNRLSKELAPIIQSYITKDTKGYLEPFVGGANMIDKIQCNNKIGYDIHEELIELLKYAQKFSMLLPETVSENIYKDVKNKTVYDYPELNGNIETLKTKLKDYYKENIEKKLFEYELLK